MNGIFNVIFRENTAYFDTLYMEKRNLFYYYKIK